MNSTDFKQALNRRRDQSRKQAATVKHQAIIEKLYADKIEEIHREAKINSEKRLEELERKREIELQIKIAQETQDEQDREDEEKRKIEEANREANRWKPRSDSDKFAMDILKVWENDTTLEKERFYHAAFVLVWFVHPKFGICVSGGIERWGKDKNKMKPFGGRRDQDKKEVRSDTAARELREETAGLLNIPADTINGLPCVFILKTNPCFLLEMRIDHNEFRRRLQDQQDPHCQEMKAVVHIPFKEFYDLNLRDIPMNGVKVNDISGRKTTVSSFFLHSLRGFKLI